MVLQCIKDPLTIVIWKGKCYSYWHNIKFHNCHLTSSCRKGKIWKPYLNNFPIILQSHTCTESIWISWKYRICLCMLGNFDAKNQINFRRILRWKKNSPIGVAKFLPPGHDFASLMQKNFSSASACFLREMRHAAFCRCNNAGTKVRSEFGW